MKKWEKIVVTVFWAIVAFAVFGTAAVDAESVIGQAFRPFGLAEVIGSILFLIGSFCLLGLYSWWFELDDYAKVTYSVNIVFAVIAAIGLLLIYTF